MPGSFCRYQAAVLRTDDTARVCWTKLDFLQNVKCFLTQKKKIINEAFLVMVVDGRCWYQNFCVGSNCPLDANKNLITGTGVKNEAVETEMLCI